MTIKEPIHLGYTDDRATSLTPDRDKTTTKTCVMLPYNWLLPKISTMQKELLEASDGQDRISVNIHYLIVDILLSAGIMYPSQANLIKPYITPQSFTYWKEIVIDRKPK